MVLWRRLLIGLLLIFSPLAGAVGIKEYSGLVQVRREGSERWIPASKFAGKLGAGDAIRTGFNAHVTVTTDQGSLLTAGGNTQFTIDASVPGSTIVNVLFGTVRTSAKSLGGHILEVRSPTGLFFARSEAVVWKTSVGPGGNTLVEVSDGLVAVESLRGGILRLRAGERLEIDLAGLHEPTAIPTTERLRRDDFSQLMRRELQFDREVDQTQRLFANELRRQDFELGRSVVDSSGARVRVEEFVVRSSPNMFTFVALNGRRNAGLSWYSCHGIFDRTLPRVISPVFSILPGSSGAPATWTLTDYTETRSNGTDTLVAMASGGHQVDLNHNSDPMDDVATVFNPVTDSFFSVTAQPIYKVLFDRFGVYANGVLKRGWSGTNIQSQAEAVPASSLDPMTGAVLAVSLPVYTSNTTFPDNGSVRQIVHESYSDATVIQTETRAVSPGGGVVTRSAFGSATTGPLWLTSLLRSAFEQTTTATEFSGRRIQLIVSPRMLIETGRAP